MIGWEMGYWTNEVKLVNVKIIIMCFSGERGKDKDHWKVDEEKISVMLTHR